MRASQSNTLLSSLLFLGSLSGSNAAVSRRDLTAPATIAGGYTYQGCYVDVGRTINAATYGDNVNMTGANCVNYCSSKGYQYAGTEYYDECYCGSSLATGGVLASEADCNTPCTGNASEPCGGPNRLTLYYSSTPVGPKPNPGVNNFTYIGCYAEGTTGRALTYGVGSIPSAEMTVSNCTAACYTAGFILAGVEYSGECYCGNTIANGGKLATDGCNMLCNGNSSEYCGGPDRLNVYDYLMEYPVSTSSSAASSTSTIATSVVVSSSTIATSVASSSTAVTSVASSSTSSLASTSLSSSSSVANTILASTSSSSSAAATPTGPTQPASIGAYSWYGCQTEATAARALSAATFAADTMTLEACAAFCTGYTYFGVEYARECYCGNSFNAGSVAAPATDCSFLCAGDSFEYCGAGNRLSVYSLGGAASQSSSKPATSTSTGTATGIASGTTSAVVSTSSAPAATGFPTGWSYQGCWIDGAQGRILSYQAPDSQTLTQQSCAQLCQTQGYTISGTEYAQQCFCGNQIVNGGEQSAESDCNTPCSGDSTEMCGGGGRLSIYSDGAPTVYAPPTVQLSGLNGSWEYQGCYEDNINDERTFFWQIYYDGIMTPNMCLSRCAEYGYAAAGLEYGEECYCGDPANIETVGATQRPESECNIVCAGNASAICGGGSRLSTYFWTGTPLYSWDFPQDYRAGEYQFLIGGVTVPLMTQESITGKITFLSKWGTGPGNETGAYELDLTLLDDFSKAWRPLHVKTDIFCSAGVILPDKGGRQLNVGGWSGESTEGVRLYWPDGSAGVWGTHDFQENVNELTLQVGRWYPSAMVMTNGSIMVIGGEVGSNGAAVPSIEVLPYTGTAPLYMDWLDRTNPNNLYPFVCVLPGGGIFVAYWNEARILDAATFSTTKTLPNAPGAVNDDTGGRTYPLEGTAVLLPQKGPSYDNLGVLICGGSTNGVSNALDNCVTIYPEAAEPEWVLERMPSARVMPCMAPLPDGTYIIANGAHHGVAGFGLATNPNLNALLYDPSKPVGSRITVMANTTVARLYHSEAITLLDGRVLISGSDPQDGTHPEEYRVEVFVPPYLLNGLPRPTFTLTNTDWSHGDTVTFSLGGAAVNGAITVSLLGAVSSTHGNSMGARVLQPEVTCTGTSCTFAAPPSVNVCPPGWYQFFVLDGGVPAVGVYVRIGGDPAQLGNWPQYDDFVKPGV
ncbi:Glyoxal oxidase-like protein [Pleurostoma richardsiae]|uniref:Glyoxal oxidase-like protein n=1 Tax=Pleurostoma richardsiae TaxID=41990 RepID=A0AA38VXZ7_9PEZI|nr:Glyoxal oxidase-like protein [Pleurostoma richardsiae]